MGQQTGVEVGVRIHKPKARTTNKLPARAVQSISTTGKYADGGGLYLVVTASGSKNWAMRYTFEGKAREAGLGSARDVTLAEARLKAAEFRAVIARGDDPLASKPKAKAPLFAEIADQFIRDQSPNWRDQRRATNWTNSLRDHARAMLAIPVDQVTRDDVLAALRPIWHVKPETASKVRGRIERILDAAIVLGHRTENPARWKGGLAALLPPRKRLTKGHHAAMPYRELPAFVATLRRRDAVAARMLEFLILTAARSGEVRGATWDEIDLDAALWTVPAHRMKAARDHRVPLVARAIEILRERARGGARSAGLVFPNDRGEAHSVNVFGALFRRIGVTGVTTHGFRSSFRDWAGDETEHPREVTEAALAHAVGDATELAYRRSDALARRRRLMEEWAGFVTKSPA
jgi:integrase